MTQVADTALVYHTAEDGDMIQFGKNCALSVDLVRKAVEHSGPIVKNAFEKWLDDMRAQACVDAFKPLANAAKKLAPVDEPAFPMQESELAGSMPAQGGMTLRDYFAAKALAGMMAYPGGEGNGSWHSNSSQGEVAKVAYSYADALLEARKVR